MPGSDNYGIQIGGSAAVNAGAMAAGPGATAQGQSSYSAAQPPADLAELRSALASLVEQLRASPSGVQDPVALAEVAAAAQREAGKDKPSRGALAGLLDAVMAGVGSATVLANAVAAIQHAISVLF